MPQTKKNWVSILSPGVLTRGATWDLDSHLSALCFCCKNCRPQFICLLFWVLKRWLLTLSKTSSFTIGANYVAGEMEESGRELVE